MFSNCTSLTSAPLLRSQGTAQNCYYSMFSGCATLSSLSVQLMAFGNFGGFWMNNVAPSGEFYCPRQLGTNETITRGDYGIPTGWTVINPTVLTFRDNTLWWSDISGELTPQHVTDALSETGNTSTKLVRLDVGQHVTGIGPSALADYTQLTGVYIGENTQYLGNNAFRRDQKVASLEWGSSLTSIDEYALAGIQKIGQQDVPDGVTTIGSRAFQFGSVLSVVTLPESVSAIGSQAFSNNSSLLSVIFKGKTMAEVQAMANYPWSASGKIFVE